MMNVEVEFIQVDEAISQLRAELTDKSLLGSILQNQGFFGLNLYFQKSKECLKLVEDKPTKLEICNLLKSVYPPKKIESSIFRIDRPAIRFATASMVEKQTLRSLPYYWRADDFYKKLGNSKSLGETVVYYANQMTSDEQREFADKKLQSELEKTKASLVEQKHQLQAKSDEINNLKSQLEQANARIAELENKSDNKELPTRTANNASKIILAMAELLQWDLSKPFSDETNGKIREILEKQGNALSKDTVGQWLKQAYDIGK